MEIEGRTADGRRKAEKIGERRTDGERSEGPPPTPRRRTGGGGSSARAPSAIHSHRLHHLHREASVCMRGVMQRREETGDDAVTSVINRGIIGEQGIVCQEIFK